MTKLTRCLQDLHHSLKNLQPHLARISVALYDSDTDLVSTYANSSDFDNPLLHYSYPLSDSQSLKALAQSGSSRTIDDLNNLGDPLSEHNQALIDAGYRSSFTLPIRSDGLLLGFVFFNSTQVGEFGKFLVPQLEIAAFAISLMITQEQAQIRTLRATLESAINVTHERDPETGDHLKRITDYTRFISQIMGPQLSLSEEYINHLVLFSSLHDIGKISIPDQILLKPGKLMSDEFEVMKTHTLKGRRIIDNLIRNHALDNLDHIDMLRDIVELHHENWDGSGYPHGLEGEQIPLSARMIAACDAFDAITTERPYKTPIATEEALGLIRQMRGVKLDPECADVFLHHPDALNQIRQQHQ